MNSMFLIIVDTHSKWFEIFPMKKTTTSNNIEKLYILFSHVGLPTVIVSDNGPQFVSDEFRLFIAQNVIKHIMSAPYHPRTNGQAERLVQNFKQAMRSAKEDHVSLQQTLSTFLLKYRTMPHSLTNETPAKLLLGRNIRTRLDLIKPDLTAKVSSGQDKMKLSIRWASESLTKVRKLWSEIIGMLDAVGFLLKYSLGLDLFLPLLIQDMELFDDVMQTNFGLEPVIPKLI